MGCKVEWNLDFWQKAALCVLPDSICVLGPLRKHGTGVTHCEDNQGCCLPLWLVPTAVAMPLLYNCIKLPRNRNHKNQDTGSIIASYPGETCLQSALCGRHHDSI